MWTKENRAKWHSKPKTEEQKKRDSVRNKKWKLEHKDRVLELHRQDRARHPMRDKEYYSRPEVKESARARRLEKEFGITLKDYQDMYDKQMGKCKICGEPETFKVNGILYMLAVDHNHSTGKVRGLLCSRCNMVLGKFEDSSELLFKAGNYLKENENV